MIKFNRLLLLIVTAATLMVSCKKDDPPLPDNVLQFQAAEQGIATGDASAVIKVSLSRATDIAVTVVLGIAENGVVYGTDYTTTPATAASKISVTIPAASSEASFTVTKTAGALFDGDESIAFAIESATAPVVIGTTSALTLTFAEILSAQAAFSIDGGGATYPNKVFIDLSANRQTAKLRTAWDLGFYCGDDFRVTVNSSTAMMARVLDKNDLNAVTAADTVGFAAEMSLNAFSNAAMAYIDAPSGDLTATAITATATTNADNKVYIINRGTGIAENSTTPATNRGWKKIRVLSTATGYKLQYADIAATTFTEVEVAKDAAYNFKYIQFETGAVDIEPAKDRWDIAWTYFTNSTNFGTGPIPYGFQDMIIQNRNGVETAKVLTATVSYEAFTEANLAGLVFTTNQVGIGADWRSTAPPPAPPASVNADRFYIIKDASGNYYKLKFTALTDNGERGKPAIEYALIKAA